MWFFRSPTVVYGEESLSFLTTVPIRRAVLVTDQRLVTTGLPAKVRESLPSGCESLTVGDVGPEPDLEEMTRHLEKIREFAPDWFVGVGGGSSIDTAKILFFLYERPDLSVYDVTPLQNLGLRRKSRLIAIPTTSGTGSECTWAAVLSEPKEKRKHELASPEIIPDYAILDPEMVVSLPPAQTRDTVTDAIAHAIEGYVSSWRNPYSDAFSEKGLELIFGNILTVVATPSDIAARSSVHIGASMAGLSFSNSQIGLAHALGHALGGRFKTPHGKAVGVFLPLVVEYNSTVAGERIARLNRLVPDSLRGDRLSDSLRNLYHAMGQAATASEIPIGREEYFSALDDLVSSASESTGMVTNPRDAGTAELRELFVEAYDGRR